MTIGRPRQFDENESLNQVMMHFWQYGYASTSMSDLTSCTGLSKSSLYNSFGNKSTLFVKSLSRFKRNLVVELEEKLLQSKSSLQFIRETLDMVVAEADQSNRMGCMLVNTANELAGRDPTIANEVSTGFAELREVFTNALRIAQGTGEISDEIHVEALADFILTGIVGLRTMAKSGADRHRLEQVAKRITNFLN